MDTDRTIPGGPEGTPLDTHGKHARLERDEWTTYLEADKRRAEEREWRAKNGPVTVRKPED